MIAALPGAGLADYALGALRARLVAPETSAPTPGAPGASGSAGNSLSRDTGPAPPAPNRMALLAVGALQDLGLDRVALMAEFGERLSFQHLAAACDCCVAGPVVSVTLGRLLRKGPLEDLLVLADARTHLEGLERALSRQASAIERRGLMTEAQRVLLTEPTRAGHPAACDLVAWAGQGMSFVGQA